MRHFIEDLRPNDHAALVYRNRAEQFAAAIPYIQVGLKRNERCLYIASENPVRLVLDAMEAEGIDVDRETRNGRLTVASPAETYLKHGIFEPDAMIEGLTAEVKRALSDGFKTFRATGELFWALALPSALMILHEYESMLDTRFPNAFIGLCQYNETCFHPDIISQMLRVHPKVVTRGRVYNNPYYVPHGKSLNQRLSQVDMSALIAAAA
jgi:DcmR-like sensory protein